MKAESDPITDDEWLLRLVFHDRIKDVVSPNAFEPRDGRTPDTDGISLYREACLADFTDVLTVIATEKRDLNGIVAIPVAALATMPIPLTVVSSPIQTIPGHVHIPELALARYKANKAAFTPTKDRLAKLATQFIRRRPVVGGG